MASYKRLVKLKTKIKSQKHVIKVMDKALMEVQDDVERLNLVNSDYQVITSRLRSRIKELETTNEFLEGKTKYLEGQVAHHKHLWDESIKVNDRLRDRIGRLEDETADRKKKIVYLYEQIKAKDMLLEGRGMWQQSGPNTFVPAEINVVGREK